LSACRGDCFLAGRSVARLRIGWPVWAIRCGLTGLMVRRFVLPHKRMPLSPGRATPGQLPSLKGSRWVRLRHRRVTRPFRSAYGSGLPGVFPGRRGTFTGQRGQPLCPGESTNHPDGPRHPSAASVARGRVVDVLSASAGLGAWHTVWAESCSLPNYPCLAPSSSRVAVRRWLRSSRERVRARTSVQVRPRTGRIRSTGVGSIAPFETEPTTPAAHTKPEAPAPGPLTASRR
jgi:hypothetical protein